MRLLAAVLAVVVAAPVRAAPPIQTRTLPNGLEVLVVEVPGSPLATVEIAVRNGSMTEPPETNGLSHLYEHMFFKANAVIADQEAYLARARELGLRWNGNTNTERVNYYFTTTTDHFADAMAFMRDAAVGIKFDPGEFEKERVVVTGELDRNESNPYYHLFHETAKRVWWKYPSRKDPLGNRKTVLAATIEQMRAIQRRYYVPNNSALIVTGGVRAGEVFAQAERLYAGWKPTRQRPLEKYPLVKHPPIRRTELVLVEQPVRTVTGLARPVDGGAGRGSDLRRGSPDDGTGPAVVEVPEGPRASPPPRSWAATGGWRARCPTASGASRPRRSGRSRAHVSGTTRWRRWATRRRSTSGCCAELWRRARAAATAGRVRSGTAL